MDGAEADQGRIGHRLAEVGVTIYTAEPGPPTEDALRLLASWAAIRQSAATQ